MSAENAKRIRIEPIEKVGYIFIVQPHSPNDKIALQALPGVTILEHPYSPQALCQGTHTVLTGHLLTTEITYYTSSSCSTPRRIVISAIPIL